MTKTCVHYLGPAIQECFATANSWFMVKTLITVPVSPDFRGLEILGFEFFFPHIKKI